MSAGSASDINFRAEELNSYLHLEKYRVILFGEQHNAKFDPEVKYHLITDLNTRTGARHIFLEASVSNAWHINRYLQTGDTSFLYNSTTNYSHSRYTILWEKLYEYNRRLPDSNKIVFHGVDFERSDVFQTLKQLSPAGQRVPAILQPIMDTINAHVSEPPLRMWNIINGKFVLYDNSSFTKALRYVQNQFSAHPNDTRLYFGTNYTVVKDIITNRAPVEVMPKHRNKFMFAAMERIIKEQNIERFIGFFGLEHTKYSVSHSLSNAVMELKGIRAGDILNIGEIAYDLNAKDSTFRTKHFREIVSLNGTCKATLLPSNAVPGFEKVADFIFIANITE